MSYNQKAEELVRNHVLESFNQMMDIIDVNEEFWNNVVNNEVKILQDEEGVVRKLGYEYDDQDEITIDKWHDIESELEDLITSLEMEQDDDDEVEKVQSVIDDTNDYDNEYADILEYWIVTDRLRRWLEEKGECVSEVGGLNIWGRGCCGQSIVLDNVIQEIYKEKYL